jgi:hypothetical protein
LVIIPAGDLSIGFRVTDTAWQLAVKMTVSLGLELDPAAATCNPTSS